MAISCVVMAPLDVRKAVEAMGRITAARYGMPVRLAALTRKEEAVDASFPGAKAPALPAATREGGEASCI